MIEVLSVLFGLFVVLLFITLIGHGIWVVVASLFGKTQSKQLIETPSAESDLVQSYQALDRMFRGGLLDESTFRLTAEAIEKAAKDRFVVLPRVPSRLDGMINPPPRANLAASTAPQANAVGTELSSKHSDETVVADEIHALDQEYKPSPPPISTVVAQQSKRALGDILQQFLNEKNIRWGELVSGLLIIGSAVGLILSLRSELNRLIPMFPSVLFLLVTVAIHLAGFYTLKKWKLPSTSRGLLVLGSIMMAVTALATSLLNRFEADSLASPSQWLPIIIGVIVFGALSFKSSESLFPQGRFLWCLSMTCGGLMPLIVDRLQNHFTGESSYRWIALLLVSALVIAHAGTMIRQFWLDRDQASIPLRCELRLLGIASIMCLISLGSAILSSRANQIPFAAFTGLASLAGATLMSVGAFLGSKSSSSESRQNSELGLIILDSMPVVGITVSLMGAITLFVSMGLAWNHASLLLLIAWINVALGIGLTLIWKHPSLTATASFFASIAAWLTVHRVNGVLPVDGLSLSWLNQVFPSLETSATSIVAGSLFCVVAYRIWRGTASAAREAVDASESNPARGLLEGISLSAVRHVDVLWVFGVIHCLIAFVIAAWLGASSSSLSDMVFSISVMALIGLASVAVAHLTCSRVLSVIASLMLLAVWCMVARTNTDLAQRLGWYDWKLVDAFVIVSLGHSLSTMFVSLVLSMPVIRKFVRKERLLRLSESNADSKPLSHASALSILGDFGLATGAAGCSILLRWDLPEQWLWQSGCLGALAISAWVIAWLLRGEWRNGVAFLASSLGLMFLFGDLLSKVTTTWQPSTVLASTVLASSLSLVIAIGSGLAIVTRHRTIHGDANKRWKAFCVSPFMDLCLLLFALYQQAHVLFHSFDWGRALSRGSRPDAMGWSLAFGTVFFSVCALTAWRRRQMYVWVAGLLSISTSFALIVTWSPGGGNLVAFLYLLACAPLIVSLCTACVDAWTVFCKRELSHIARQAWYEWTIGIVTIFLWILATGVGLIAFHGNNLSELIGFCSPVGLLWFGIGVLGFSIRSSLESSLRFVQLLSLSGFLLGLNLPIALSRGFSTTMGWPVYLTLLLVGTSLYVLTMVWLGVQGVGLGRRTLAKINYEVPRLAEQTISLIRKHSLGMSCVVIVSGAMLVTFVFSGEAIRLTSLSVAMIGFAAFLLLRAFPSQDGLGSVTRYLAIACWPLFFVYLVWSNISFATWHEVWCSRILRLESVLILVCIELSILYARVRRKTQSLQPETQNETEPKAQSMLTWITERSRQNTWSDTLTRQWIEFSWILIGLLVLGLGLLFAIGDERLRIVPTAVDRSVFGQEVLWMAGLAGLWISQLIVQAVRIPWNIAQLKLSSRSYYVYVAEVVFCLVVLHVSLVRPDWFQLPFREYWPVVMLMVAVVGQAIAAILKRFRVETISAPVYNTSLLLPIVAPLGMIALSSRVGVDSVLASSSMFYFFLGATERSRRFAMAGGILANIALLFFWRNFDSLNFLAHPQLWLVPPAVSVAIATHLQRDRLNPNIASWIRYFAMATVFCSSSSEILLSGLGKSLLPPMILLVLSVVTVFVGIGLQVRSYLYSGILFTLFAMVAMVAHAQQSLQHTWPWWVLGITLGIGILVLFALFERKRDGFTKLSNQLKQWDG